MTGAAGAIAAPEPASDVEGLLAPIPGDDPTGESLRFDVVHDEIRELRREDDPTLPQGVWRHELKRADWRGIARLTDEVLRERSKDLQMAVWLVEAWTRLDGLSGLGRGIDLLHRLIDLYGDRLHPRYEPDEEGEEAEADDPALRVAALARLEGLLLPALARLPFTRPRSEDAETCTWGDWKRALYLENLSAAHPEAASEADGVTRERFLASVGLTPDGFYPPLAARATSCREALARLATLADERYGADAPAYSGARAELGEMARIAARLAAERGEAARAAAEAEEPPGDAPDPAEGPGGRATEPGPDAPEEPAAALPDGGGPCRIAGRGDAYRALEQAADVLLRIEPHSPVPYLVQRAVRWGSMSLSELYGELFQIAEPNVVFRLLGIQPEDEE